jgi:hypothetical protein
MAAMLTWQPGVRRAVAVAVAIVVLFGVVGVVCWAPGHVHAGPLQVLDVPMPPRSRLAGDGVFISGRGFRPTVDFYKRFLKRSGMAHEEVAVYRYRGVEVARFLSRQGGTRWAAIQVWRHGGRVMIYVVARSP